MFFKKKFNIKIKWEGLGYYRFSKDLGILIKTCFTDDSYYLPEFPYWFIGV
jgi:hypothetical protein